MKNSKIIITILISICLLLTGCGEALPQKCTDDDVKDFRAAWTGAYEQIVSLGLGSSSRYDHLCTLSKLYDGEVTSDLITADFDEFMYTLSGPTGNTTEIYTKRIPANYHIYLDGKQDFLESDFMKRKSELEKLCVTPSKELFDFEIAGAVKIYISYEINDTNDLRMILKHNKGLDIEVRCRLKDRDKVSSNILERITLEKFLINGFPMNYFQMVENSDMISNVIETIDKIYTTRSAAMKLPY